MINQSGINNQNSLTTENWIQQKNNNRNHKKQNKVTYSSPAKDLYYNKKATENTAVKNSEMALATALQDLALAQKQVKALNRQINNFNQKEINLNGALQDVAQLKNENESLKIQVEEYAKSKLENEKGIHHPNRSDLSSSIQKSNKLIKDMQRFQTGFELFEGELVKINENKTPTLEELQTAMTTHDPRYGKFSKTFKDLYKRIEIVSEELNKFIKEGNYVALPKYYHSTISAKQDLSVEILQANEKIFDENFVECKKYLSVITDETLKINSVFKKVKTQLDKIENRAVFIKKNWNYNLLGSYYGETIRLTPTEKAFFAEEVEEVKAKEDVFLEEKNEVILEVKEEIVLEVKAETV